LKPPDLVAACSVNQRLPLLLCQAESEIARKWPARHTVLVTLYMMRAAGGLRTACSWCSARFPCSSSIALAAMLRHIALTSGGEQRRGRCDAHAGYGYVSLMARLKVLFVRGPRDVVGLLLLALTSSVLLVVMFWLVNDHKTAALDRVGFDLLASTPGSTFARVGDHGRLIAPLFFAVLLVALVVTTVMRRGAWADAAGLVGGFVLCLVAARLLKTIELRPRPPRELIYAGGYSFPSTDSALAVGIAAMAVVTARLVSTRRRQIALIATGSGLTVFAGLLFVALRVHYASDVIAGWALGCAAFACCALAATAFVDDSSTKRDRARSRIP
jgi:membrane-associated phospholipid phosphatase